MHDYNEVESRAHGQPTSLLELWEQTFLEAPHRPAPVVRAAPIPPSHVLQQISMFVIMSTEVTAGYHRNRKGVLLALERFDGALGQRRKQ